MSVRVVGPRYPQPGGKLITPVWHLAPALDQPTYCGQPVPRKGWRVLSDAEADRSEGCHDPCWKRMFGPMG